MALIRKSSLCRPRQTNPPHGSRLTLTRGVDHDQDFQQRPCAATSCDVPGVGEEPGEEPGAGCQVDLWR